MNGTIGVDLISYGVSIQTYDQARKYQRYYQFIAPTLCLQALIFYLPCWIWERLESGKMNYFMSEKKDGKGKKKKVDPGKQL